MRRKRRGTVEPCGARGGARVAPGRTAEGRGRRRNNCVKTTVGAPRLPMKALVATAGLASRSWSERGVRYRLVKECRGDDSQSSFRIFRFRFASA
eukprot:117855-Pyramimonas_sp.AAC.1